MDWTLEGTYTFRIDVTDTQSDVTHSLVTFQIVIKIMNATSITVVTTPGSQIYTVSAPMLAINLPTYSWFPTQSHTVFTYSIVSGPGFVTLGGSPQQIQIYTTVAANTGTYTIQIKTTETNSGLFEIQSFSLLVKCVLSIAPSGLLTDVVYYITMPAELRTPLYQLTPADCPYELVLTVTQIDNSPLPGSITYTAPSISTYETNYALTNIYQLKIVATDPKTGLTNSSLTMKVTIKCT